MALRPYIAFTLAFAGTSLLTYLLGAFWQADFNIARWSEHARASQMLMQFFAGGILSLIAALLEGGHR